ncbi:MAG: hypothetical protein PSX71_10885 [bacterium]|nr:hypothetical protein [bacterium]
MFQSFSISSSSSARFLAGFTLAAGLLLALGVGLALYIGAPSGDLVRIGKLASIDLKPRHLQQPLYRHENSAGITADVRVLGDSFSGENLWQSELRRLTGLKTQTWHYKDIGCIDDWISAAIKDHAAHASRIIIVESIEREFMARFSAPQKGCTGKTGQPLKITGGIETFSPDKASVFPIDIRYVAAASRNHFTAASAHGKTGSDAAISVDLTTDRLFSNVRNRRLSYFEGDDAKWSEWSPARQQAALAYLAQIQALARQKHKQLLVLIIPDKSTTYAPWVQAGQLPARPQPDLFLSLAGILGESSNYLPAFRQGALQQVDFYRPDDTHLSLDGYRFLAREISQRIHPQP